VADLKRLKELEAENSKLKRLYSELALENAALCRAARGVAVLAAAALIWKPERTAGITSTYDSTPVTFVMNCTLPLVLIPAMDSGPTMRRHASSFGKLTALGWWHTR